MLTPNISDFTAAGDWKFTVFISHAGPNKNLAEDIKSELTRLGFTAFLDKHDLHAGDDADRKMETYAQSAPIGLVLLSEEFLQRKWPMRELELIVKAESLLPVIIGMSHTEFKQKWRDSAQETSQFDEELFRKVTRTKCIVNDGADGAWPLALRQEICFSVLRVFVEKICPRLPNEALSLKPVIQALKAAQAIRSGELALLRIMDATEAGNWVTYLENLHDGRIPWGSPFR